VKTTSPMSDVARTPVIEHEARHDAVSLEREVRHASASSRPERCRRSGSRDCEYSSAESTKRYACSWNRGSRSDLVHDAFSKRQLRQCCSSTRVVSRPHRAAHRSEAGARLVPSTNPPLRCVSMRRGTTRLVAMTTDNETGARDNVGGVTARARSGAHARHRRD
jgi:hypothetical protein